MWPRCLIAALTCGLGAVGRAPAQPAERNTETQAQPAGAQPAVLIVRVTDSPVSGSPARRLEVVEPRGLLKLPLDTDANPDGPDFNAEGAPQLGPGCTLVRSYESDTLHRAVHYYVYHLDLADPTVARRWEEFQRAQRAARRQAAAERRSERQWDRRKQRLLTAHGQAVQEGLDALRAGDYRAALISLTRAAELDHADPACRIHLAQARVALGHDLDAAKVLRRALELQPKLVPMVLGLEQYYPHEEDFAVQVDSLARRLAAKRSASAEEYFLLGFMAFQRGWLDDAYAAFQQAGRDRPKDALIRSYLDITKPPATAARASQPARQ